jgi:uncharacterized protein (DUF1015 family)
MASLVASPPYDVIDTREARALAAGNPASFLHVSRPEIALPEGTDEHADAVYEEGKKQLARFVRDGILRRSAEPGLFLYAQTMGTHRQVGLVACASVDEYDRDLIKKHEKTRPDKEDDRTRHIETLEAHDEPVFLTYTARPGIDALVKAGQATLAEEDFVTADGVRHEIWSLSRETTTALVDAFEREVSCLYVADGHHRSAAASRVHASRKGRAGEHDTFLSVIFPHDQMQILPYNRLVRDDRGRSAADVLRALGEHLDVAPTDRPVPPGPASFALFDGERWHLAKVRGGAPGGDDPVARLDCSLCQDEILARHFGIADPRRDRRVDFVGGIRGTAELERRVREEGWTLGISMHPTHITDLMAVSDRGLLMPPKSTWFEPKLRSGLFVHPFG